MSRIFIIAEAGVNHNGDIKIAKQMIDVAAHAGADAVKFQTFKAEKLVCKTAKKAEYQLETTNKSETQYEMLKKLELSEQMHRELMKYCMKRNIMFLSTPFDIESVDYLEPMMNVYKISSSDLNNLKFVEYQAKKNKPVMLSVGASNEDEIRTTLACIRKYNDLPIILMHCVLEYPTPYEHANLNKIVSLAKTFPDVIVGYSDHTKPDVNYDVLKTAYNLGAKVIEKHYTLDKTLSGNDHYHAMDNEDAKNIIEQIEYLDKIRGNYEIKCLDSELTARANARRSLVTACDIKAGTVLEEKMLTFKRPGTGILANRFDEFVGKMIKIDIAEDTVLQEDMF